MVTDAGTAANETASDWISGYQAGVAAAIAEIEQIGRPHMQGFNAPLIIRVRERIEELARHYPCLER